jgi:hypothetical protein
MVVLSTDSTRRKSMKAALTIAAFLALPLAAGMVEYGLHGGVIVPTGDPGDAYSVSYLLGGQILIHLPVYTIEGSASYAFLQDKADQENFSAHMIPLLAGIRTSCGPLFYGGGAALHFIGTEYDITDDSSSEHSDSYFGAYATLGTSVPLAGRSIELAAKAHWIDFDEIWIALQAGIYL